MLTTNYVAWRHVWVKFLFSTLLREVFFPGTPVLPSSAKTDPRFDRAIFNRPYSYSQYWTVTSLQWRLMRGNLFKCKYFLIYSPALASIASSKFSRHFFNQSEEKPKPIVARACTFSRALCKLRVITSSFDWFTGLSPSFLIGQSNYFGFGFTTLD